MSLAKKSAFVTGGGRGLGRAIALALAEAGARVTVAGRNRESLDKTAAAIAGRGGKARAVVCDVTDDAAVQAAVDFAQEAMGAVDILVNNAGVAPTAPLARMSREMWEQAFAVNATGAFLATQACLEGMLARGFGRIINVASIAGVSSAPYLAAYSASKHALIGLTRAAAAELSDRGIQVNALCPAYVDTEMTRGAVQRAMKKGLPEAEALELVLASGGQKRLLPSEEVAAWAVHLAGPAGNATNGQVIVLDGGGKNS